MGGILEEDLIYRSIRFKEIFKVPIGTRSNYGDVPWWWPKWLLPRGAQFRRDYFLHDYFYRNPAIISKWKADIILFDSIAETAKQRKKLLGHIRPFTAWIGVGLNIPRWIWWKKPVPWEKEKK